MGRGVNKKRFDYQRRRAQLVPAMSTTATPALPAFTAAANGFDGFLSLALSRVAVRLEWANYAGNPDGYRADRARIRNQLKDLRAALAPFDAGTRLREHDGEADRARKESNRTLAGWLLMQAAEGDRFSFDPLALSWSYCPGQYYPVEVRGAAARVARLASSYYLPSRLTYLDKVRDAERMGNLAKEAGRALNGTLKGISRWTSPDHSCGYWDRRLVNGRLANVAAFAAAVADKTREDVAAALAAFRPDPSDYQGKTGLAFIRKHAETVAAEANKAHALAFAADPSALYEHAARLYPRPFEASNGIND